MGAAETVEQLIGAVRAYARRAVGADGIAIVLRDGSRCHYVEEDAIAPLWKGQRFPLESCVSGWAMLQGRTAVIPDILSDRRVPQEAYRSTFVRSMAMAPMGRIDPQGAIGAYWAEAYVPSETEIAALDELARLAGLRLAELQGQLPTIQAAQPSHRFSRSVARLRASGGMRQLFLRVLPAKTLPFWRGQLLAVLLIVGTALVRGALGTMIGQTGVFSAFIPAVLLAALYAGPKSAMTAIVFGSLAGALIGSSAVGNSLGWAVFVPAAALVALVGSTVRAVLDEQKDRTDALEHREKQLSTIARELDHRSRNTLAVVTFLTHHASRAAGSAAEMRDRLCGHFDAMARTQTSLLEVGVDPLPLKDLLGTALLPFVQEKRILIDVPPDLLCPSGSEVMLSLAFSELATNACKHGALLDLDGEVEVVGRRHGDQVHVVWTESGGPKVVPPERSNGGSRLIARAVAALHDGQVESTFLPAGAMHRFSWSDRP